MTRPVGHQLCLKEPLTAEHLNKDAPKLLLTTLPTTLPQNPLFPQKNSGQTWPWCGMIPALLRPHLLRGHHHFPLAKMAEGRWHLPPADQPCPGHCITCSPALCPFSFRVVIPPLPQLLQSQIANDPMFFSRKQTLETQS